MNLYFLVEGEETETQLYPKWLSYIVPKLSQVNHYNLVTENNFYIFSGGGIPSIYNHAVNAITDVNSYKKYDYLVIALDGEEISIEKRIQKLIDHLKSNNAILIESCQLVIIVHNPCIETWFLGNRKAYKRNPQGEVFKNFTKHFNVELNDPEIMDKAPPFSLKAHFHGAYLREMLKEHNITYRKSRPQVVLEKHYFDELVNRIRAEPDHLKSLSKCIDFFEKINTKIN